jgi:ParB/RepB/Spo0J family partition protein
MSDEIHQLNLSQIGESYGPRRIINARADACMLQSIKTFGQMSPVVCLRTDDGHELVDGFKRLRALRSLKAETLKCVFVDAQARVGKARIIQLNQASRSISDIEEALVLQSLHRIDGLSQVEISVLLGRDKSWVCRRISLIEKLSDSVQEHIRLGLISSSVGRALALLPRGNQQEVLYAVLKHHLGKRAVERLVRQLITMPTQQWSTLLYNAWSYDSPELVAQQQPCDRFSGQLKSLLRLQKSVIISAQEVLASDHAVSEALLEKALTSAQSLKSLISRILHEKTLEV